MPLFYVKYIWEIATPFKFRLVLRCRADARQRFAKLRSDVLVKLELLDNKHVQDIVFQLRRLMSGLTTFHTECAELMKDAKLFPIEVDLTRNSFQYKSTMPVTEVGKGGGETQNTSGLQKNNNSINVFKHEDDEDDPEEAREALEEELAAREDGTNAVAASMDLLGLEDFGQGNTEEQQHDQQQGGGGGGVEDLLGGGGGGGEIGGGGGQEEQPQQQQQQQQQRDDEETANLLGL